MYSFVSSAAICLHIANTGLTRQFPGDIFGTKAETSSDRLAGIWFRIEKGPEVGPGVHSYDESGVVWEGNCEYLWRPSRYELLIKPQEPSL